MALLRPVTAGLPPSSGDYGGQDEGQPLGAERWETMFKCKGCGKVYAGEECFGASDDNLMEDDRRIFDGKEMRNQCPACGGLVYPVKEETPLQAELAA